MHTKKGYGYRAIILETESLERHQAARTKCHLLAHVTDGTLAATATVAATQSFTVPIIPSFS